MKTLSLHSMSMRSRTKKKRENVSGERQGRSFQVNEWAAQHLSEDALNAGQGEACVVGFDDPPQQLVAQHLQDHAHVW